MRCFVLLLFAASLPAQILSSVRPDSGKVGAVLRVQGTDLSKQKIDSVYLSDQTLDMMVKVLNQTDNYIEFRIPPSVKPGRFQLVVKTAGKEPQLLEMPVYVRVEELTTESK
ncbi:MAG TPA: IPT/TIG domain-containing protein [Bryobacteraceae bacterium]|nr:IPT/TIG domain-containing protein [Bryobacteraceae bacterium]